jgi:ABC-type glycerol-3-phosphate transport system substrate-binding protein
MAHAPRFAVSPRLCLFALLAILLSACGFQETVVTAIEPVVNSTVAPAPITLRLWHTVSPQQAETLQAIANSWSRQQSQPVVIELESQAGAESLHQALLAGIQTQHTPDLAFVRPADLPFYAEADALVLLKKYWESLDPETQEDYFEPFLTSTQCEVNDSVGLWAMPTHRYQTALFANTTYLNEVLKLEGFPRTWEAFNTTCNAHLAISPSPCLSLFPTGEIATLYFLSHDNPIVDTGTRQATLTDTSAINALTYLSTLRDQQATQLSLSYDGTVLEFAGGRTLFTMERTDRMADYSEMIGNEFEWEVMPFPGEGSAPRTLATGGNLAVFHTTPERETLALSFLEYMNSSEINARWAEAMEAFPVRHSALERLLVKNSDPRFHQAAELLPDSYNLPCVRNWQAVETHLTQLVSDTMNNVAPPDMLLAGAAQATNNLVR